MGVPRVSFREFQTVFSTFSEPLCSLCFSLLSRFSLAFLSLNLSSLFSFAVSLLSARASLLCSRFFSISPAARRFSRSDWDPPPPAWQGSRACESGVRFHQSLSSEGPRAFRRPRRPGHVLATSWRIPVAQNAILEPPMASKMPSWSFRWPSDRQIMQMSETNCLIQQTYAKISKIILINSC